MKKSLDRAGAAVYALAFAVPVLVMLAVWASLGMAPWGDNTVLISDMSTQYVEFFCALKRGDLFFSWSKALGTSYIGVFSYYVSSPLSLLTLLVPNEAMPEALLFLITGKIGLAGLTFAVFARHRFPGRDGAALFGAVCYALMSYNMIYAICVMWLDGVIWLPLILLAVERLLAGRGAGPFIAALTVCFFSTWYISYMAGAFCALYLCARLIALRPARRELARVLGRFFGGAACALGLTAWMWLPTFLAMFGGKFGGANVDYDGPLACHPLTLLAQLLPGRYGSIGYGAPPYVFCGTAAVILAAAYFFLRAVPPRDRLANAGALAALVLSILLSPLDKAWHLFQRPNWFPFRYSFVFSFFLLYLAVQSLGPLLEAAKHARWVRGAAAAVAAFTLLELGGNAWAVLGGLAGQYGSESYARYQNYYAANERLAQAAAEDAGGGFYRMGAAEDRGLNSPLSFGYPGITHYSSLYNGQVNRLLKKLGFAQAWMWCASYGSTPATDALLGIEYVAARGGMPAGYEPVEQAGGLTLWKNPDALPLAFLGEAGAELDGDTPFARQNSLFSALLGEEAALFTPLPADSGSREGETVLTFTGTGRPVYADLSDTRLEEVLVDGERLLSLGRDETASVHCLGTPAPGQTCTVTVRGSDRWSGELWELDMDALHAAAERLNNTDILSVGKNGRVELAVQGDGRPLLTTIPAESGWTARVDGAQAELSAWLDGTFLALDLPAGPHTVELRYTAPGLIPGLALGALSLAGLAAALPARRRGGGHRWPASS